MSERVVTVVGAAAAGRSAGSAVRGMSGHREMVGLNVSAGVVREMNLQHHSIAQEVLLCFDIFPHPVIVNMQIALNVIV